MKKQIVIFFVGLVLILGVMGCSLFLGPLSRLSLEALTSQEWEWTWVGVYGQNLNSTAPRFIQTYRVIANDKPGFVLSFVIPDYTLWIHFFPSGGFEVKEISGWVGVKNSINVAVSSDQREAVLRGVMYISPNHYFHVTNLQTGSFSLNQVLGVNMLVFLPEKIVYEYNASLFSYPPPDTPFGGGIGNILGIFGVVSDEKGKSLVGVVTNSMSPTLLFLDENGADAGIPSLRLSGFNFNLLVDGVRRGDRMYVVVPVSQSTYELKCFVQGQWREGDVYLVVDAADHIKAIDIVVYEDLVCVASVREHQKIKVQMYQDTTTGFRELSSQTLQIPADKGNIEGIDFFYDKAGKRFFLGVFHGLESAVGVSYYTLHL